MSRMALRLARFLRIAPAYLQTVARREWRLMVLALVGLAPGVAALIAWGNLAHQLTMDGAALGATKGTADPLLAWLLPSFLLEAIGAPGVLLGTGMVTLLIGCLGLTNAYLASIGRRADELALFVSMGLSRAELMGLMLLEALAAGLLGSGVGVLFGAILSWISWPAASAYFHLLPSFRLLSAPVWIGAFTGVLAALLFMGTAGRFAATNIVAHLRPREREQQLSNWQEYTRTLWGAIFTGVLMLVVVLPVLPLRGALMLLGLSVGLGALLGGLGWIFAALFGRLPTSGAMPLWTMAVQGLSRHANHTAGMVLALTAGSYGVGAAALSWLHDKPVDGLSRALGIPFPLWVAAVILVAAASLVLTIAELAAWERRSEFGMLMALGARTRRIWRLVLLEYGIVALVGGTVGSLMALINWAVAGGHGGWLWAIGIVIADLLAAIVSAWAGALPVLLRLTSRSIRESIGG